MTCVNPANRIPALYSSADASPASVQAMALESAVPLTATDLQECLKVTGFIDEKGLLTHPFSDGAVFELEENHQHLFEELLGKPIRFSVSCGCINYEGAIFIGGLLNHLREFCCQQEWPVPHIEIVGGYVRWVLLSSPGYCQKVLNAFGCNEAAAWITPEFLEEIRRYPPDYDIRILVPHIKEEDLSRLNDQVILYLASAMKTSDPAAMVYWIQNNGLRKKKVTCDRNNKYATITFGRCDLGSELELLFVKKLKRNSLFVNSEARVGYVNARWALYSTNNSLAQFLVDILTQNLHGRLPHEIDRNGWASLISYISKGYVIPEEALYKILLQKMEPGSEEFHSNIEHSLQQCLKNHHRNDSLEAVALAFNAAIALKSCQADVRMGEEIEPWKLVSPFQLPLEITYLGKLSSLLQEKLISYDCLIAIMETTGFLNYIGGKSNSRIPFRTKIRALPNAKKIQILLPGKRYVLLDWHPGESLENLARHFPKSLDSSGKEKLHQIILGLLEWRSGQNAAEEAFIDWNDLMNRNLSLLDHTEPLLRVLGYCYYAASLLRKGYTQGIDALITQFPDIFYHVSAASGREEFLNLIEKLLLEFHLPSLIDSINALRLQSMQGRLSPAAILEEWTLCLARSPQAQLSHCAYAIWLKYGKKMPSSLQKEIGTKLVHAFHALEPAINTLIHLLKNPKIPSDSLIDCLETLIYKLKNSPNPQAEFLLDQAVILFKKSENLDTPLQLLLKQYLSQNKKAEAEKLLTLFDSPTVRERQQNLIHFAGLKQAVLANDVEVASALLKDILENPPEDIPLNVLKEQTFHLLDRLFSFKPLKTHLVNILLVLSKTRLDMISFCLHAMVKIQTNNLFQETGILPAELLIKTLPALFSENSRGSNSDKTSLMQFLNSVLNETLDAGKKLPDRLSKAILGCTPSLCLYLQENNLVSEAQALFTCLENCELTPAREEIVRISGWLAGIACEKNTNWIEKLLERVHKQGGTIAVHSMALWIEHNLKNRLFDPALIWIDRALQDGQDKIDPQVLLQWLDMLLNAPEVEISNKTAFLCTYSSRLLEHPGVQNSVESFLYHAFDLIKDYKVDLLALMHTYGITSLPLWQKGYEWIGGCIQKKMVQKAYLLIKTYVDKDILSHVPQARACCWAALMQSMNLSGFSIPSEAFEDTFFIDMAASSPPEIQSKFSLTLARHLIINLGKKLHLWKKGCEMISQILAIIVEDIGTWNSILSLLLRCGQVEGFSLACRMLFEIRKNSIFLPSQHPISLEHLRIIFEEGAKFLPNQKNNIFMDVSFNMNIFWLLFDNLKEQPQNVKNEFITYFRNISLCFPHISVAESEEMIHGVIQYNLLPPKFHSLLWKNLIEYQLKESSHKTSLQKSTALNFFISHINTILETLTNDRSLLKITAKIILELELENSEQSEYFFGAVILSICKQMHVSVIGLTLTDPNLSIVRGWDDIRCITPKEIIYIELALDLLLFFIEHILEYRETLESHFSYSLGKTLSFFTLINLCYILNGASVYHQKLALLIHKFLFEWDNLYTDSPAYKNKILNLVEIIIHGIGKMGLKAMERTFENEHLSYYHEVLFLYNEILDKKNVFIGNWEEWRNTAFRVVTIFLAKPTLSCHLKGSLLFHDWIRIFWKKTTQQKDIKIIKHAFNQMINYMDYLEDPEFIKEELKLWKLLLIILNSKKNLPIALIIKKVSSRQIEDVNKSPPYDVPRLIIYLLDCSLKKMLEKEQLIKKKGQYELLGPLYTAYIAFLNELIDEDVIDYFSVCFDFVFQLLCRVKEQESKTTSFEFFKDMVSFLSKVYKKESLKVQEAASKSTSKQMFQYNEGIFLDDYKAPSSQKAYNLWTKCLYLTYEIWVDFYGETQKEEILKELGGSLQLTSETIQLLNLYNKLI